METLLTRTLHYDMLINLSNVMYFARATDDLTNVYFLDGSVIQVQENFEVLTEELHDKA